MNDRTLETAARPSSGVVPGDVTGIVAGEAIGRNVEIPVTTRAIRSRHTFFRSALNHLATTLFPADCRVCGAPLLEASMLPVCHGCLLDLHPQTSALCARCGEALEGDMESARFASQFSPEQLAEDFTCTPCRLAPPPFEHAVAFGVYGETLRELVHLLKYDRVPSAAGTLGWHVAQAAVTLPRRPMLVIAVPLFPAKQRQRAFNQAILLADAMTAHLRKTIPDWHLRTCHSALARVRNTESQFALTPQKRRDNLRGAFKVKDFAGIAGEEVMLIDDIYTTGATASECARVLLKAGATRVWVVTLSRAQPEFVDPWGVRTGANNEIAIWDAAPVPQLN